ncbi:hypothetical protein [Cohnella sp. OV330]|uniref:hypothetical protein n=1 Tax=Cohnella sp. OV330 TaxID=1855288 RepID=UPI001314559F|nr:hypothetical protein [Cohnella sp. OV330]
MRKRQRKKNETRVSRVWKSEMTKRFGQEPLEGIAAMTKSIKEAYYSRLQDDTKNDIR